MLAKSTQCFKACCVLEWQGELHTETNSLSGLFSFVCSARIIMIQSTFSGKWFDLIRLNRLYGFDRQGEGRRKRTVDAWSGRALLFSKT